MINEKWKWFRAIQNLKRRKKKCKNLQKKVSESKQTNRTEATTAEEKESKKNTVWIEHVEEFDKAVTVFYVYGLSEDKEQKKKVHVENNL